MMLIIRDHTSLRGLDVEDDAGIDRNGGRLQPVSGPCLAPFAGRDRAALAYLAFAAGAPPQRPIGSNPS
jgi:hypothetical protein